jgi:methylenetetrahydrofolate dehydrogenase (NADP+)/methenyltetrahydrofolate cyclohydrolase
MTATTSETIIVDGLALAQSIRQELSESVAKHVAAGRRPPCLAVVVGDDPASQSYIKGKRRACERIGMQSIEHDLATGATEESVLELVGRLNADDAIDGILTQLPLPDGIRPNRIAAAIDPSKDVDGLNPLNAGRLLLGEPCLAACTPLGIMKILEHHEIELVGADVVVIGRSILVGKPVSLMLQQRHATVTMCHSRTRDLAAHCRRADVVVAAVGAPRLVQGDWIKPGAAVIDVGVSEVEGKLVGDVDTEAAAGVAKIITPHRRGVGPMTITMLLRNTLTAYENRA